MSSQPEHPVYLPAGHVRQAGGKRIPLPVVGVCLLFGMLIMGSWLGNVPRAHDLRFHLSVLDQVREAMGRGDFYPRWLGDFNQGYGEPTLVFYPPLFYLAGGLLAQLPGISTLDALVILLFFLSVLGAGGIYRLAAAAGGRLAGLIALGVFLVIPFRSFELDAAGLFPAYAAGCLLPWALHSLWRLCSANQAPPAERRSRILWCSGWLAMIVLCNLPYALLTFYLTAAAVAVLSLFHRKLFYFSLLFQAWATAILLAAFFLLPAVLEWKDVTVPFTGRFIFADNFIFAGSSSWMSPELKGIFARMLLLPLLVTVVGAGGIWKHWRSSKSTAGTAEWAVLLLTIALLAAFLTIPWSTFLWQRLPFVIHVNLPWRFLDPLGCAAAALAGVAASAGLTGNGSARWRWVTGFVLGILGVLLLLASLSALRMNGFETRSSLLRELPRIRQMDGDYLPRNARRPVSGDPLPPIQVVAGEAAGQILHWWGSQREMMIRARTSARLRFRSLWYEGWQAEWSSDGRAQPLTAMAGMNGLLEIVVPAGEGRLRIYFGTTPLRTAAGLASLAAWLFWVILLLGPGFRRRAAKGKQQTKPDSIESTNFRIAGP